MIFSDPPMPWWESWSDVLCRFGIPGTINGCEDRAVLMWPNRRQGSPKFIPILSANFREDLFGQFRDYMYVPTWASNKLLSGLICDDVDGASAKITYNDDCSSIAKSVNRPSGHLCTTLIPSWSSSSTDQSSYCSAWTLTMRWTSSICRICWVPKVICDRFVRLKHNRAERWQNHHAEADTNLEMYNLTVETHRTIWWCKFNDF